MLGLLLAGCGSSNSTGSGSPGAGTPKCADIWIAGKTLPAGYDGCLNKDGSIEAFVTSDCKDGGSLGSYDDRFWIRLPGGKITAVHGDMSDDPAYKAGFDAC